MLLEMTIAIGLTAILLTLLFRFLVNSAKFEQQITRASASVLERQRVVERLESILTNLQPSDTGSACFYTTAFPDDSLIESLVVLFNAGIDPDPEFSSLVTGRIYVTKEKELLFTYWPLSKKGYRTELLLQNVQALEWQFFGQKAEKDLTTPVIANSLAWLKEWPKERKNAPEMIRLKIWCGPTKKRNEEPTLQLAFILPPITPLIVTK